MQISKCCLNNSIWQMDLMQRPIFRYFQALAEIYQTSGIFFPTSTVLPCWMNIWATQVFSQCSQTSVYSNNSLLSNRWKTSNPRPPHRLWSTSGMLRSHGGLQRQTFNASSIPSVCIHSYWCCVIRAFYSSLWIALTEWLAHHLTWLPVFITLLEGLDQLAG